MKKSTFLYLIYLLVIISVTAYLSSMILNGSLNINRFSGKFAKTLPDKIILQKLRAWKDIYKSNISETINSEGFRDYEHPVGKPNNTYRIIALGDSMTVGIGVSINYTWPKQVERKLNSLNLPIHFEVLNFGIPGAGSLEEVKTFKEKGLKYSPDMVILQFYGNDFEDSLRIKAESDKLWKEYKNGTYKLPPDIEKEIKKMNANDHIVSGIIRFIVTLEYDKNVERRGIQNVWRANVEKPLLNLIDLCKRKKIKLVVISWDLPDWEKKLIINFFKKYKIPFEDFSSSLPHNSAIRLPDDHLSRFGYKLVADKVLKLILYYYKNK